MKIGIIVPSYNAGDSIEKTIMSVISQTSSDWEMFIIDGNSTDCTIDIVQNYSQKEKRIKYISEPDCGINKAMNKRTSLIDGEYILFMGAGDVLADKNVIEDVQNILESTKPDILYGYVYFGQREKKCIYRKKVNLFYTIRFRPISHQALFSKKSLLIELPFDETYKITSDQDWIMHQYKCKKSFEYIDRAICIYDITGLSSNPKSIDASKREMEKILGTYYPKRVAIYKFIKKIRSLMTIGDNK